MKENPTWFEGESYSSILQKSISDSLMVSIQPVLSSTLNQDEYRSYSMSRSEWAAEFYEKSLGLCSWGSTVIKINKFDATLDKVKSNSEALPWYPKGFEILPENPEFAIKTDSGSCTYSFGSCIKFKIVSKLACPSNLYVEAKLTRNGEVVDWGNDTTRVSAMQVARMEISFGSRGDSVQFSKISCY